MVDLHGFLQRIVREITFNDQDFLRESFQIVYTSAGALCWLRDLAAWARIVEHFLERKARELKLALRPVLAPGAMEALLAYRWPGNVRELRNLAERLLILEPSAVLDADAPAPGLESPVTKSHFAVLAGAGVLDRYGVKVIGVNRKRRTVDLSINQAVLPDLPSPESDAPAEQAE